MPHVFHMLLMAIMALQQRQLAEDQAFKVLDFKTGAAYSKAEAGVMMATSEPEWVAVWANLSGAALPLVGNTPAPRSIPRPTVDLEHNVVICVIDRPGADAKGYEVTGTSATGKTAVVQLTPVPRSKIGIVEIPPPYALFTVPRTRKPIEVQLFVKDNSGVARWVTIAMFSPTALRK